MRHRRRTGVRLARRFALMVGTLLLALAAAGPAAAKDVSIVGIDVEATVRPNGDLHVVDTRTLRFSGHYRYVYWDLATKGAEGIRVRGASGPSPDGPATIVSYGLSGQSAVGAAGEPGTFSVRETADVVTVQLHFDVADTDASFTVEYVARAAAKRWSDIAELYWQFIGADTDIEAREARVTVHLPGDVAKDQIRAWAHGPLWGMVTIQPDASVVMEISPLPAGKYVEGRIVFPEEVLDKAPAGAQSRLDEVLTEEKRWADAANRERLKARLKVVFWGVVGFGFPLAALVIALVLYLRYGREPKPRFQAQYLRDIPQPQLPPALAASIWRMGSVANDDVTATLLDLVHRGVIDLERVTVVKDGLLRRKERATYKLTLHEERLGELLDYERQLCFFLFTEMARSDELVLSELKSMARKRKKTFAQGFKTWKHKVAEEDKRRGFLDAKADQMASLTQVLGAVATAVAAAAAVYGGFWWAMLGALVGLVLIPAAKSIKRRSPEAAELHAQYAALERYLKDFGRLQEKPPDAVAVWEQFLVFAVVFGIADKVTKAMTVKLPEVVNDPAFHNSYLLWWGASGQVGGGLSAFSEIHQSFSEAVSVATSSSSSGSGGGGGFSGGGGGGGGGGGFGAG